MDRTRSMQANRGSGAASIISPTIQPTSNSFLHSHRSHLAALQQHNRQRQLSLTLAASQPAFKMERFKHVGGGVQAALDRKKGEVQGKERKFLKKHEGKSVVKRGVDPSAGLRLTAPHPDDSYDTADWQAGGDFDPEEESVYAPYPQSHPPPLRLRRDEEEKQALTPAAPSPLYSARSSASSASSPLSRNFIAANALSVIHTAATAPPAAPAPVPLHSAYGRVPSYLTQRKAEMAAAEAAVKAEKAARAVPQGMRKVGEEERLSTLARLRENAEAVERDLMGLPLRCETISRKRHKAELEAKLKDIEEAITLFSKKTVYITLE